jgi:hypothetical protein
MNDMDRIAVRAAHLFSSINFGLGENAASGAWVSYAAARPATDYKNPEVRERFRRDVPTGRIADTASCGARCQCRRRQRQNLTGQVLVVDEGCAAR